MLKIYRLVDTEKIGTLRFRKYGDKIIERDYFLRI